MSKRTEIAQQLQTNLPGFFGMKLHAKQMIPFHRR
jgi:hypothetical protein